MQLYIFLLQGTGDVLVARKANDVLDEVQAARVAAEKEYELVVLIGGGDRQSRGFFVLTLNQQQSNALEGKLVRTSKRSERTGY